jgi:hypothetical protein
VELIAAARRSPCLTLLNLHCNYLGQRAEAVSLHLSLSSELFVSIFP